MARRKERRKVVISRREMLKEDPAKPLDYPGEGPATKMKRFLGVSLTEVSKYPSL